MNYEEILIEIESLKQEYGITFEQAVKVLELHNQERIRFVIDSIDTSLQYIEGMAGLMMNRKLDERNKRILEMARVGLK